MGVGSNMGDRLANIERSICLLREHEDIKVLSFSSWIETEAQGGLPQGKFLNGVIQIYTDLLPLDLLSQIKMIERRLGRKKTVPNAPRPIDLDILFYDDVVIVKGKNLNLPHPRLTERRFVLEPLAQIAPDLIHPRLKKSVKDLLLKLPNENTVELQGT